MQPLISILIPAYNSERWIAESINSALAQSWQRKEIIIVDDGSRDRTFAIARQFASPIVSVVTQENQGAAAARNKALALSQGDYIQWLDADDILAEDKIAKQMAATDQSEKAILFSGSWGSFIYRPWKAQFHPTPLWCDLSPLEWLSRKMEQNLHMQTATWLVSRELTQLAGPWDVRLSLDDDGEYFCRVLLACDRVRFVSEAKVLYRAASSTSLRNVDGSNRKMESQFRSTQLHVKYIRSLEDSEPVRRVCLNYLQRRVRNFVPERPDLVDELKRLAISLGGRLQMPKLGGRYSLVERVFGYGFAKNSRFQVRRLKWGLIRAWDKVMARFERQRHGKNGDHLAGTSGPIERVGESRRRYQNYETARNRHGSW
jgi:glycosyltransferase involved in cell wall biosynthesis